MTGNYYITYTVEPPNNGQIGAGVLSTVERLSLSRRLANKPRPSILRSRIDREAWPAAFLYRHTLDGPYRQTKLTKQRN